jgi:hypothetical protein
MLRVLPLFVCAGSCAYIELQESTPMKNMAVAEII